MTEPTPDTPESALSALRAWIASVRKKFRLDRAHKTFEGQGEAYWAGYCAAIDDVEKFAARQSGTPDTPESELTGDGLRAARRVADVLVSEGLIAPDIFDYAVRDKDIAARLRLAALPNREAAPREATVDHFATQLQETGRATVFDGGEAHAVLAALRAIGAQSFTVVIREAAPREGLDALEAAARDAHIWSPDHERGPFDSCAYEPCRQARAALRDRRLGR